jgi:hypothetical protein
MYKCTCVTFKPNNISCTNVTFKPYNISCTNVTFKPKNISCTNVTFTPNNISCTFKKKTWLLLKAKWTIFSDISWRFNEMMFTHFVLHQSSYLDFNRSNLLKQQSMERHVAPLCHIILLPSHSDFNLAP